MITDLQPNNYLFQWKQWSVYKLIPLLKTKNTHFSLPRASIWLEEVQWSIWKYFIILKNLEELGISFEGLIFTYKRLLQKHKRNGKNRQRCTNLTGNINVISSPSGFKRLLIFCAHTDLISGSMAQKNLQYKKNMIMKPSFWQEKQTQFLNYLRIIKNEIKQLGRAPSEEVCL